MSDDVNVDPALFRLRAFEEEWLEPLAARATADTPLDTLLLLEAEAWLGMGQDVAYFAAQSLSLPLSRQDFSDSSASACLAEWIRSTGAPTDLDAARFGRALSDAREDLTSRRRELLHLLLFADNAEWDLAYHELVQFCWLVERQALPWRERET